MEKAYVFSFEKLNVWHDARELVKSIYLLVEKLPKDEKFSLIDQLKRSGISVASNIVEGTSRSSYKEKIRFIEVAYGSLLEMYSQLILCTDLGYIENAELLEIKNLTYKISNELNALKNAYNKSLNN